MEEQRATMPNEEIKPLEEMSTEELIQEVTYWKERFKIADNSYSQLVQAYKAKDSDINELKRSLKTLLKFFN